MRVLHVMGRLNLGGTERQLVGMLQAAQRDGLWEPTLCLLRPGGNYAKDVRASGIKVLEYPIEGGSNFRRLRALRAASTSRSYDVIHSSLWGANAFSRAALLFARRPAIVISERRVEDFRSRWQKLVDRTLANSCEAFIGNSDDVVAFVSRWHGVSPGKVHRVFNGLDKQIFRPRTDGRALDRPDSPFVVGALGRLIALKGFDDVIEAVRIAERAGNIKLLIAGDGPERERLQAQAAGLPVSFTGKLNRPVDVANYLRSLDVFVHASRAEGLPNVVLEAQACGVPTIVTEAPGMSEVAPEATRVPVNDPKALAAAIIESRDRPRLGAANQIASFEDVARQHLEVFSLAISNRRERS